MNAETAYLFRHALLRDAAYQLQLPGDRARLHALAFHIIEQLHGGRARPELPLSVSRNRVLKPHRTDSVAQELALHIGAAMARPAGLSKRATVQLRALREMYLRRAAVHAERQFRLELAAGAWLELAECNHGRQRAVALLQAANMLHKSGRWELAKTHAQAARRVFRSIGSKQGEVQALTTIAAAQNQGGQLAGAERTALRGVTIARRLGNRYNLGILWSGLGNNYQQSGRLAEAEQAFHAALKLHLAAGNMDMAGSTLGNLAVLYQLTHRRVEAERAYRHAVKHTLSAGNLRSASVALANFTDFLLEAGKTAQAEEAGGRALALACESGSRRTEGVALGNLANVYRRTSRLQLAEESFDRAIEIHREVRNRMSEGSHLCDSAYCKLALGRLDEARVRWHMGISVLVEMRFTSEARRQREAMRVECAAFCVPPFEEEAAS